ncbi:hypothetical protein DQ239_19635 [Blastococcus sp. TF02-09]|uniref:hypothetical protein n=1 Tax=Blastococcus sp. TF02-09 TaxID=2250576 RepID=UPI000DE963A9|nr:hypothetical protein [Blastococcus sp. TF02-9]RBY74519.1 hypothetical protein DQ239_19635 [Blastococcus sp. TF02-9]
MASGLAAALVLVPAGLAQAGPLDPNPSLGDLGDLQNDEDQSETSGDDEIGHDTQPSGEADIAEETETGDESETGGDTGELPVFVVGDDEREAFKELTRQLGIPDSCVDGIADSVELIIGGLLDPEQLEAIIAELESLLGDFGLTLEDLSGGLPEGEDAGLVGALAMDDLAADAQAMETELPEGEEGAPGGDFIAGIELLVKTLSEDCVPETDEGGTPVAPVDNGTPAPPVAEHPAAAPVAQPVSYPGYAPTGADSAQADDASVPMTALAGGLVLVAAGAAGYGMRGRAVRTRD